MEKLKEGQKLWWAPRDSTTRPSEVTVLKVGRTWAQLDNHKRIDVVTLVADGKGYLPPGRCYLNQAQYDETVRRNTAWSELKLAISGQYRIPDGVSADDIDAARKLLRL